MTDWAVTVQILEIESRGARVSQLRRIDVRLGGRPIGGDVVPNELAEEWPPCFATPDTLGVIVRLTAVAEAAHPSQCEEKLLIGGKRGELGKQPAVLRACQRRVDLHAHARRRE